MVKFSFKRLVAFTMSLAVVLGLGISVGNSSVNATSPSIKNQVKEKTTFSDYNGTDLLAEDDTVSFSITKATKSDICQSYSFTISNTGDNSYILGYYGEGDNYKPLTFCYDVTLASGKTEARESEMYQLVSNEIYDSVGSDIAVKTEFTNYADLFISKGEEVVSSSLKVINIYKANKVGYDYEPDFAKPYYLDNPTFSVVAQKNYSMDNVFTGQMNGIKYFGGYSSFDCSYESSAIENYKTLNSTAYASHKSKLNNGTESIRFRFTSLTNGYYHVVFKDGTEYREAIRGTSILSIKSSGHMRFVIKGIDPSKVESFFLEGVTVSIDIINTASSKQQVGTILNLRFGGFNFANSSENIHITNINTILILVSVCFLLVFAGCDTGYFFYKRNKYKNDEFNRVETKPFIVSSVKAGAAIGSLILDFIFILTRATGMNNSFIVFNPLDAYICAFSIILILFIGYYIKQLVKYIKDTTEKRRTDELKINDTVDDDGTGNK